MVSTVPVVLGGCGAPGDTVLDVVYDPCEPVVLIAASEVSEEEHAGLETAVVLWDDVMETGLTLDPDIAGARLRVGFENAAPMYYGNYDDEHGVISINRDLTDPEARAVVIAHELGHAFGLFHISGRDSVMNPANLSVHPTPGDAEVVHELWGTCELRSRRLGLRQDVDDGETGLVQVGIAPHDHR